MERKDDINNAADDRELRKRNSAYWTVVYPFEFDSLWFPSGFLCRSPVILLLCPPVALSSKLANGTFMVDGNMSEQTHENDLPDSEKEQKKDNTDSHTHFLHEVSEKTFI